MPQRTLWIIGGLTLALAVAYAADLSPWLRGGFGWRWEYLPVPLARAGVLALTLALYLAGAWGIATHTRRPAPALLWSWLGAIVIALAAGYARDGDALYALFVRVASEVASAEHWASARIDWAGGEWRDWVAVMQAYGGHVATRPPGMFVLYALTESLVSASPALTARLYGALLPLQCHNYELLILSPEGWASAWFGILSPVWAGLAVYPLHSLARRFSDAPTARQVALWWALVPGMAGFVTSSSTLFPVVALLVMRGLVAGLDAGATTPRGRAWLAAAGVGYGAGMMLNFVFLPLAALYGFYTLAHAATLKGTRRLSEPLLAGAIFGAGALIPWGAFTLLTTQTFFDLLAQSLGYHLQLERPYWFWVGMHVWDWVTWTGFAFSAAWLWGLWRWWRARRGSSGITPPPLIGIALALSVLAFTLTGTTRGESGRIWLFLSPFVLVAAGEALARAGDAQRAGRAWLALGGAQAVLTLALLGAVNAYPAPDISAPPPPPATVSVAHEHDATFSYSPGGAFRLTGWAGAHDGDALILDLRWQGVQRPEAWLWFGATLVSPAGDTYGVAPWQPADADGARYPTTCWAEGQVIGVRARLPLPPDAQSGAWWVSLAVFGDPDDPEGRLPVRTPAGEDRQIGLGPVVVSGREAQQPSQ